MVAAAVRLSSAATLACFLALPVPAKEITDYRIGDTADQDIVAPMQLVVIDAERTAGLKYDAGQRIPVVFRYDPTIADEVEKTFLTAFTKARATFLEEASAAFHPLPFDAATVSSEAFARFVAAFNGRHRSFPVATDLAALWAQANPGDLWQSNCAARLRSVMEHPIRSGTPADEFKHGGQVRIVAMTNRDEALTLDRIEQRGRNIPRTNALILAKVRSDFQQSMAAQEQDFAKVAAAFIRTNCFLDTELTRQYRARRTEATFAADTYERGQPIVRHGQVIDKKIMAALDLLREKTQVAELRQTVTEQKSQERQNNERNRWLLIALAGVTGILVLVIWRLGRHPQPASLLPARIDEMPGLPGLAQRAALPESTEPGSWEQRALTAERRAERTQAALRSGVLPYLAQMLKGVFVRRLISQRASLMDSQQKAADDIAELDKKLDDIHAPLQERLRAYERRIGELEKELAKKGEESRELLKAKIFMARKQLEAERAKNRMELN